jgi:hypothetical protein
MLARDCINFFVIRERLAYWWNKCYLPKAARNPPAIRTQIRPKKGKVVPVLNLIKHYAMKAYGGVDV